MDNSENDYHLNELKKKLLSRNLTSKIRPDLVEYVKNLLSNAKDLPEEKLLGAEGLSITDDLSKVLVWQITNGGGWITEKDEPILWEILSASSALEEDPFSVDKWKELLAMDESLK